MKAVFALLLLALLGCTGSKPVPSQTANAGDDPRCEAFYEAINKNILMSDDDFNDIKEEVKKYRIYLNEPIDLYEISNAQSVLEIARIGMRCNDTIFCKQKYYCASILDLKDSTVKPFKF